MARMVKHIATGPVELKTEHGDSVWICRCGLTGNQQTGECDSTHKKLLQKLASQPEDEKNLIGYDPEDRDSETNFPNELSSHTCCGHGCT